MITLEQIEILYQKYSDLVKLEISEFGVKPTEVRHLIGRLGEFYCALKVSGKLSHKANQHGFDVLSKSGKRISVKTTAQTSGFVAISSKTIHLVDEIMILQYINNELVVLYFGDVKPAIEAARYYDSVGKYELDISKAKKLK